VLETRVAQLEAKLEEAARATAAPSEPAPEQEDAGMEDSGLSGALSFWAEVQKPEHDPAQLQEPAPRPPVEPAAERGSEQPVADDPIHLVMFQVPGRGYVLSRRSGNLPEIGAVVDLSDDGGPAAAVVAKIAPAPLPGPTVDCAYLI